MAQPRLNPVLLVRRLGTSGIKALAAAQIGILTQGQNGPPPLKPNQWPQWAKAIATIRQPGDIGLGDTLVHQIGDATSEAFKTRFEELVGSSCGCADRQRWLNAKFPYLHLPGAPPAA
jgi:hypothetical protein